MALRRNFRRAIFSGHRRELARMLARISHGKSSDDIPGPFHEELRVCDALALVPYGSRFFSLHHIGIAVAISELRRDQRESKKVRSISCGKLDEWKTETELF